MLSFAEAIRAVYRSFGREKMMKTVTRLVHNPVQKFAIGTVDDFLNIESSVCDATAESLSWRLCPIHALALY